MKKIIPVLLTMVFACGTQRPELQVKISRADHSASNYMSEQSCPDYDSFGPSRIFAYGNLQETRHFGQSDEQAAEAYRHLIGKYPDSDLAKEARKRLGVIVPFPD